MTGTEPDATPEDTRDHPPADDEDDVAADLAGKPANRIILDDEESEPFT